MNDFVKVHKHSLSKCDYIVGFGLIVSQTLGTVPFD